MAKFTPALMLVFCLASARAVSAQEMTKPLGKWERKIGKNHVTLIVDENRIHILCTGEKAISLHADYAMTHDGLVYGVVTSIECDEEEEANMTETLFDAPFSFRFRIDEAALIIHNMKAHEASSKDDMWNGRYKIVSPYKAVVPAATRGPVVPTSYFLTPSGAPTASPPPATPIGTSFSTPPGVQTFNFWTGFSR